MAQVRAFHDKTICRQSGVVTTLGVIGGDGLY